MDITLNDIMAVTSVVISLIPWGLKLLQPGPKLVHTVEMTGVEAGSTGEYRFVLLHRSETFTLQGNDNDVPITFTGRVRGTAGTVDFVNYTFPAMATTLALQAGSAIRPGRVYRIPLTAADPGRLQLGPHDHHGRIDITRIGRWLRRNGVLQIVAAAATGILVLVVVALTIGVVVRPDPLVALIGCGLALFCAVPGLLASRARDQVNPLLTASAGT